MNSIERELVILVHGFARSRLSMAKLARRLGADGYEVINWGYNSLCGGIEEFGQRLAEQIATQPNQRVVHGVGHSLGGLILRQAFALQPFKNQRLVTLGTPHYGATLIARHPRIFNPLFIPQVLSEMHPDSLTIRELPIPPIEIGIIAGVQQFHLLNLISWLNCLADQGIQHDGTVDVESTKIKGLTDYLEVSANHSFLPSNNAAIAGTIHFLRNGLF